MGQAQVGGGGGEIQRLGFRAAAGRRVDGAGRAKPLCSMQREQRPAALDLEQEKQRPARRDSGGAAQEVSGEVSRARTTTRNLARLRSLRRRTGDEEVVHGDGNLRGSL